MIEIGPVSEDEMILAFLGAEIQSPRFGPRYLSVGAKLGIEIEIVTSADLANRIQNEQRRRLLTGVRGFDTREYLFAGFPLDTVWRRVGMTALEVSELNYLKCEPWVQASAGTRLVHNGARNIAKWEDGAIRESVAAVVEMIAAGVQLPPIIAAGSGDGKIVLIEGHVRATALAICGLGSNLILGHSFEMGRWFYW
jgi:hypothetical protein